MNLVKEREKAKNKIIRFAQKWGEEHLNLACHAAFPLALTPELLYCLRENFLPQCPWIAVADIILSPLCDPVGNELYEMDGVLRDLLLKHLATDSRFEGTRLNKLADFMGAYIEAQLPTYPKADRDLGKTPEWVALAYIHGEDAQRLRQKLEERLRSGNSQTRQRLANFWENEEDLLIAAGLEPLIAEVSEQWHLGLNLKLETIVVKVARFVEEEIETPTEEVQYQTDSVETVLVDDTGKIIETKTHTVYFYEEVLGDNIPPLIMMVIPEGDFIMGSPKTEPKRYNDESPHHKVTVAPFWLAQTPITQAQWNFVANLPQIQQELSPKYNNNENDHPVTELSWYDAMEFCARLSRYTGSYYRLPSEAEWEYACRAGTTTPFHFGETITGELANYDATSTYANEPAGENPGKTIPVKSFSPNAFGLYDMHGQVWEWCADPWHENYEAAPKDSRVWDEKNKNKNHYQNILESIDLLLKDDRDRVMRGGSWFYNPDFCRSACRDGNYPVVRNILNGFRVACGVPGTL